ncbi:MAG: ABC transporter substrate-binding protein [Burkholderiales bacterium]|nr:ABC transporter substrate-binding protein [Burkholderiales bacterium]
MRSTLVKFALTLIAGASFATGAAAQAPLEEVKIAFSWLRNGQYAGLMVADAKGYFAEEGLKVSFIDGGPGKNPIPTVGVNQAQFGVVGASHIFLARLAPTPVDVVAIGALIQDLPYAYITLGNPGDPDPTPKDLEGKRLGLQSDGDLFIKAFAKRNNLDISKIKMETVLANAEPLMVGKVDFFTGMLHNQTYQVEQEAAKPGAPAAVKGKVWKAMRFTQYGVPSYGDVLFTTTKMTRENPELVRKVSRAVAKGMKFTIDNPAEAVKLVDAYPQQIERADKLAWRFKAQNPMNVSADTKARGLLWMDPKTWEAAMAFYKEYEQIPRVAPVGEVMTNAFNPAIKSQ